LTCEKIPTEQRRKYVEQYVTLCAVSIILMFIILILIRRALLNMAQTLDLGAYTPSDYCIQGSNMKFDDYAHMAIEDSLKDYFHS
jgi:hypothetical protein